MLFALLLIGGPITGAHFNPAVTLGVYISNRNYVEQA
jgi:glycerol uptake facilitator-like aquaporin